MRELTVDEMKAIELEIACEIDRVCRACGIGYFLGYGSMLGAVRHGGFIPWDDDMDVVMMRDDYERFFEAFPREAGDGRFRIASYRDGTAPNAFLKVVDATTKVEERYSEDRYGSGVWVDIFPYDAVSPSDDAAFRRASRAAALRYLIVTDPATGATPAVRLAKRVVCPALKRLDPFAAARRIDEIARASDEAEKARRAAAGDAAGEPVVADLVSDADLRGRYPARLFEPVEAEFEGRRFFIPSGYDEILTKKYGDWRTPPPTSQRETHACRAYRL